MVKHDSLHIQMKNVVFLSCIKNALEWNMNTYTLYDYEEECNDNNTISTIKQMLKDYCMCNLYNRERKIFGKRLLFMQDILVLLQ